MFLTFLGRPPSLAHNLAILSSLFSGPDAGFGAVGVAARKRTSALPLLRPPHRQFTAPVAPWEERAIYHKLVSARFYNKRCAVSVWLRVLSATCISEHKIGTAF